MANINLSWTFINNGTGIVAYSVQYARIDNTSSPVFIPVVPNPITSPAVLATNIPNGQYQINALPIYADGRTCTTTTGYTPPCAPLISLNAVITDGVLVVTYLAPSGVPQVQINVSYPNGGSFSQAYVNDGNPIAIAIPAGLTGNYSVTGQSICDPTSMFLSPASPIVTVTVATNTVILTSDAAGIVINTLTGISGFTLPSNVTVGSNIVGVHDAFTGVISFTWTGTPDMAESAGLTVNNTLIQCVNIPITDGGTASFNSASFAQTDIIEIDFNSSACP